MNWYCKNKKELTDKQDKNYKHVYNNFHRCDYFMIGKEITKVYKDKTYS